MCPSLRGSRQCTLFVLSSQYVLFGSGGTGPFPNGVVPFENYGWSLLDLSVACFDSASRTAVSIPGSMCRRSEPSGPHRHREIVILKHDHSERLPTISSNCAGERYCTNASSTRFLTNRLKITDRAASVGGLFSLGTGPFLKAEAPASPPGLPCRRLEWRRSSPSASNRRAYEHGRGPGIKRTPQSAVLS
jgi:hypothetical protein